MIKAVILAGGSGTRLWPLSRAAYPKQFLALSGQETLLQSTFKRLESLDVTNSVVICNENHRFLVAEQLREINRLDSILLEPIGKNTAPAIALAAITAEEDPLLLVLAADHVIQDQVAFKNAINNSRQYNFSQGVVVRNKKVVSLEGKDGTKMMLKKSRSKKFRNHGVLVKLPKKKQDLRIDLPTIGLKTLKQSKTAGLKGIVVKNKQHVFLDKSKCINFANKNGMFILVK